MSLFNKIARFGMGPAIRLIKGGANQKTTQGMIRGGTTSKGGVETMKSMGNIPRPPKVRPPSGPFKPRQIGPQLPPTVRSYGTLPKTVKTPPIGGAMKAYIEGFKTANKANKTIKDVDKFMSTSKNFAPKTKVNMSDIIPPRMSTKMTKRPVPKKAQPKKK
jgi:hypothetical protein